MPSNVIQPEPGSYQDRDSRVFYQGDRVCRVLGKEAYTHWMSLSACPFYQTLIADDKLVFSRGIHDVELPDLLVNRPEAAILEHERVPFISYPYEWCFGMLKDAALLQLEILLCALDENMILKDATPYNIQWVGTNPVFIDVLSFEPLQAGSPWLGYNQFCQLFLYPLLIQSYKNLLFHPWLRGNLQGISLEDACRMFSIRNYLRPGVIQQAVLPFVLQASFSSKPGEPDANLLQPYQSLEETAPHIRKMVRNLHKLIANLSWKPHSGAWKDYIQSHTYDHQAWQQKTEFVDRIVHEQSWGTVWDLGCNTGHFSRIAARNANLVLALDSDPASIEVLYQDLKETNDNRILPLVFNLADPSPSLGWLCSERKSITERGKPDLILCLALVHHLVIRNNIPMDSLIAWLSRLRGALIIEFVSKTDPMAQQLLKHKQDQYADHDQHYFEHCLEARFVIRETLALHSGTRILYFCIPRHEMGLS